MSSRSGSVQGRFIVQIIVYHTPYRCVTGPGYKCNDFYGIIYSLFASSPPSVVAGASAISQVWMYIGELIFNMLVLVGSIKLSDQVVKNMMGL